MVQRRNKRRDAGDDGYRLRLAVDASGGFGSGYNLPPQVVLNHGFLIWPQTRLTDYRIPAPTSEPILFNFSRLWMQSDDKIARFAVALGPLNFDEELERQYLDRFPGSAFAEPVLAWRNLSRRLMAILGAAADLRAGRPIADDDWRWFETTTINLTELNLDVSFVTPGSGRLAPDPALLGAEVHSWCEKYPVPIALARGEYPFRMEIQIEFIGVRLAMEMMAALSQEPGLFRCSRCALPYWPQWRKPRVAERHYCSDCVIEARRERNLAAWHRNKSKYRPGKVTAPVEEVQDGETAR